jgi:hypothetical protein
MSRHLTRHERPRATKVMIVYSRKTGKRRLVIDADDDAEYEIQERRRHRGEGFFYLTHASYDAHTSPWDLDRTTAHVAGFSEAPHEHADRHEVVASDGSILGMIHCDPSCGDLPDHVEREWRLRPGTIRLLRHAPG